MKAGPGAFGVFDRLHFEDGRFQSAMCQSFCDFGGSEFRTLTRAGATEFTTRCLETPHSVIRYGTVTGETVRFEGRRTTRRWYWTRRATVTSAGSETPLGHEDATE